MGSLGGTYDLHVAGGWFVSGLLRAVWLEGG